MRLGWPLALSTLLVVPVLLAAYVLLLRRRRPATVPFSSVALLRAAGPRRATWKRHVPVALLLAALAALCLAAARPQLRLDVPITASSVILAVDVSGSMCATDVAPNRLSAAQDAVRQFVRDQDGTRIGLVAFAGFAQLVVEPTTDTDQLTTAIDSLTTGRGTAIGAAMLKSVDAIATINPDVGPANTAEAQGLGAPAPTLPPRAPGDHVPEIVVLLTDGANTHGVTPVEAAKVAAARGVRVYPIGFGTTNPTAMVCTAEQLGGTTFENFGGRGFRGGGLPGGSPLVADEPTLRQVASTTGGTYYSAGDADQLQQVFEELPRNIRVEQRDVEVSAALAALAALLVICAALAAARWSTNPSS